MTAAQRKPLKQKVQVRANTTRDSVCKIGVPAVKFSGLQDNYVTGEPYQDAKIGDVSPGFGSQCTIRMGVTLYKVGMEMKSFTPANVPVRPGHQLGRILMEGRYTAVLADQMGSWLSKHPFCGLRRTEDITDRDWESEVKGRAGIIMFDSYWSRNSDFAGDTSGGHADPWNGSRLTVSRLVSSIAIVGRTLGMNSFLPKSPFGFSDLGGSKKIFFWEVK